jgi:hypothetical protein
VYYYLPYTPGTGSNPFVGVGFDRFGHLAHNFQASTTFRPPEAGYGFDNNNHWMTWKTDNISSEDIAFTLKPVITSGAGLNPLLVGYHVYYGYKLIGSSYLNDALESSAASNDGATYSIENAVNWLNDNAHNSWKDAKGQCAKYIRRSLEAGFGLQKDAFLGKTPVPARLYGPFLQGQGFSQVQTTNYQIGDIAVIQGYPGATSDPNGVPYGHIQMYDGNIWISDFKQMNGFWPGPGYRRSQPGFTIYRWGF